AEDGRSAFKPSSVLTGLLPMRRPSVTRQHLLLHGNVSNDICPFPLTIDGTVAIDERQFFDQTGARTAIDRHSVEQDTFSANGKSLTGLPITYNVFHPFNSDGNNTDVFTDGVLERVRHAGQRCDGQSGRLLHRSNP